MTVWASVTQIWGKEGVSNSNAYEGKGNKVPSEKNTEVSVKKNGKRP